MRDKIFIEHTCDNCKYNTPEQFDDGWFCRRPDETTCEHYEAWEKKEGKE